MESGKDETEIIRALSEEASALTTVYLNDPHDHLARIKARTAARNLHLALQADDDAQFFLLEQTAVAAVVRMLNHLRVPQAVPSRLTDAIPVADLAAKLGCETHFILRMMRTAVAGGFYAEPLPATYSHNAASRVFLEPTYVALHDMIQCSFEPAMKIMPEYFQINPKISPNDPLHHPLGTAFNLDGKDWTAVLARDAESMAVCNATFSGRWTVMPLSYPFDRLATPPLAADEISIVDVGGHHGGALLEIQQAHPSLQPTRMILQDTPAVLATIPPSLLPASITPMAHDFWTPQPIHGARAYFLRRILHDWPDAHCVTILQHVAAAMAPSSVLLISEMVVPDRVQRDHTWVYTLDVMMLVMSGKERSRRDWKELFDAAGLQLVQVWMAPGSMNSVIEAKRKDVAV